MPYFIEDDNADCSGWATVKQDGEVMGCHQTKADAIDQMVALSIAEGIEPGGERSLDDPSAIIVDVDGTLLTFEGDPIAPTIEYVNFFAGSVYVVTARVADDGETRRELEDAGLQQFSLAMKPDEETDSVMWKQAVALRILDDHNVILAIDDDAQIRAAYRELGIEAVTPQSLRSKRDLPDAYRPALSDDVPEGRACGNCSFYNEDMINEDGERAWCSLWEDWVRGDFYCDRWEPAGRYMKDDDEERQVDLDPPAYIRAAAARGLELHADGLSGNVTPVTVREARLMASGDISPDKVTRANAWGARHEVDLEAPSNSNADDDGFPGRGAVAHYLWGINPLDPEPARSWFARKAAQLADERFRPMASTECVRHVEFRALPSDDGLTLEGYAAVFNSFTEINDLEGRFREQIAPGAFKRTLGMRMPVLQFDHGQHPLIGSIPLGRITAITEDKHGLRVRARLSDNWLVEPVRDAIRDGAISGMSFRFRVIDDDWSRTRDGMAERTIREVELYEVGPVVFPAYADTTVGVRSAATLKALQDPETRAEIARMLMISGTDLASLAVTDDPASSHSSEPDSPAVRHLSIPHVSQRRAKALIAGVLKETQS